MPESYSWNDARATGSTFRLPGPDRLSVWASIALVLSLLLHLVLFFAIDYFDIGFRIVPKQDELNTERVFIGELQAQADTVQQIEAPQETPEVKKDTSELLDDIDILDQLPKDKEIEAKPEVLDPEYALKLSRPAQEGEAAGNSAEQAIEHTEVEMDIPQLGTETYKLPPAEMGQITIDPGAMEKANDDKLSQYTQTLIKKGAGGQVAEGMMDGMKSIDTMLDLPRNVLLGSKTMLPSDLLFEFNSSALRESAKIGLMKIGLLMDRNPDLYCWLEGHTDLIGGEGKNLQLSISRAESVKQYLVQSLRMDQAKIITRGFGRAQPIVLAGNVKDQGPNRRVEIKMRKDVAPAQIIIPVKKAVEVIEEVDAPAPAPAPAPAKVPEVAEKPNNEPPPPKSVTPTEAE